MAQGTEPCHTNSERERNPNCEDREPESNGDTHEERTQGIAEPLHDGVFSAYVDSCRVSAGGDAQIVDHVASPINCLGGHTETSVLPELLRVKHQRVLDPLNAGIDKESEIVAAVLFAKLAL